MLDGKDDPFPKTLTGANSQWIKSNVEGLGHSFYKEARHCLLSYAVLLAAPLTSVVGLDS